MSAPILTVEGQPGTWRIYADGEGAAFHHADYDEAVEQADLLAQRYGGTLEHGDFLGPIVPLVQSDADTDPTHPARLVTEPRWLEYATLAVLALALFLWGLL